MIAYFDLAHGLSGDMAIAALAAAGRLLGIDVEARVGEVVSSLDLDSSITFVDDERGGLACLRVEVKAGRNGLSPGELRAALERAELDDRTQAHALRGLDVLVRAEADVHGVGADDVSLHELGSADTAVDLAGVAAAVDAVGITQLHAAAVPVPHGWISTGHGAIPLPAPVTLSILEGARLRGVDEDVELVTPTGAAILVAHDARFGPLPEMTLRATGVAGGSRITPRPNISRVLIGEGAGATGPRLEDVVVLEANIDDQTPEALAHATGALLGAGALDAWVSPITMKKSRAAFTLSVIARPDDEQRLLDIVFRQTTTLGVRRRPTTRWCLDRELCTVHLDGMPIDVKVARLDGEVVNIAPEADACSEVARATDRSFADVHAAAIRLAEERSNT